MSLIKVNVEFEPIIGDFPLLPMFQYFNTLVLSVGILLMLTIRRDKNFRLYNSKGYLQIANSPENTEIDATSFLLKSIKSYNKYLERILGVSITKLESVFNVVASLPFETKILLVIELYASSPFEFLRTIRSLLQADEQVTSEPLLSIRRRYSDSAEYIQFAIPLAAILISILDLMGSK